jgi:predicted CoA-binding protein
VLAWYLDHSLPVTPINPRAESILNTPTIKTIGELQDPTNTSVSVITPPEVTEKVLEEAVKLGVKRVWLQPGSWNEGSGLLENLRERGVTVVAGGQKELGHEGACVLVHGEDGLKGARAQL